MHETHDTDERILPRFSAWRWSRGLTGSRPGSSPPRPSAANVTALQIIGLIRVAERMSPQGAEPTPEQWRALFQAAIRPLLREV